MSTLLGPEEAAALLRATYLERPLGVDPRMGVHAGWFRPYLENYTVDASIFWNGSLSFLTGSFSSSLHVVHAVSSF